MNILLDTHILIWALEDNPKLSDAARKAIINGKNVVFVSTASIWEISIKKAMGKLIAPDNLFQEIEQHRFTLLDINYDHAQLAGELPNIHKDPFDRMLVAQATLEKLTLITADSNIYKYDVKLLTK